MFGPSPIVEACARIRATVSLSSLAARKVQLKKRGSEWAACCPFHDDRSPSFTIYDDDRRYQCFGCGAHGDALDFVRQIEGVGLVDAIRMIDSGALPAETRPVRSAVNETADKNRTADAMAIWQGSVDAPGTEAETYLAYRGLGGPVPPSVRFARLRYGQRGARHPVLVALVVDAGGTPQGIQRTYLADGGRGKLAVEKPKLSLGRVKGGAIRLAPALDQVILAEGMEDALTLQRGIGLPAWAAAGAGLLPSIVLPRNIRSVAIGADADPAGETSAQEACRRFVEDGRSVRILRPSPPHKDFNAELCAEQAVAA
jgi:DNA primase